MDLDPVFYFCASYVTLLKLSYTALEILVNLDHNNSVREGSEG